MHCEMQNVFYLKQAFNGPLRHSFFFFFFAIQNTNVNIYVNLDMKYDGTR